MHISAWIVVGGVIGWLPNLVMMTSSQQEILLNVAVGILGAVLAGWVNSLLTGAGMINQGTLAEAGSFSQGSSAGPGTIHQEHFSLSSLTVSVAGAVVLLAAVNLIRYGVLQ